MYKLSLICGKKGVYPVREWTKFTDTSHKDYEGIIVGGAVCYGVRFQAHLNAASTAVCGFGTFEMRFYVRFAVS